MCLTCPGRVVVVEPDACLVDTTGRIDRVSTLLADVDDLRVGDWVLVSGGTVVRRLDPDQAAAMSQAFELVQSTRPEPFGSTTAMQHPPQT